MKKILALLLSLAMLLSVCAFAEEAAPAGHRHELKDLVITYGENTIDLSNIDFCLDVSPDDDAVVLHIDADGETAAELGFTKVDNLYVMHMDGPLTGHKDFVTDPVVQLAKSLQGGVDGLIEMLQGVDTTALAEKIMAFAEQIGHAPGTEYALEPEEEPAEEPAEEAAEDEIVIDLSEVSIEGDINALFQSCVQEIEGEELDGSNGIPAGTYTATHFIADEQKIAEALNMVYVKGEPAGLGDTLLESGISAVISVVTYKADGVEATDASLGFEVEGEGFSAELIGALSTDESGETGSYNLSCSSNDTNMGVKFTTFEGEGEDKVFAPASVDVESAVNVDEMSDEEVSAEFISAFQTLMADAITPVLGPVLANPEVAESFMVAFAAAGAVPEA